MLPAYTHTALEYIKKLWTTSVDSNTLFNFTPEPHKCPVKERNRNSLKTAANIAMKDYEENKIIF